MHPVVENGVYSPILHPYRSYHLLHPFFGHHSNQILFPNQLLIFPLRYKIQSG